jgi:predicted nucleic acid-binding protein
MRIYLDVCCLNRPLDDLSIGRNRLEAEAVLEIIRRIRGGQWEMVGGEPVDAELSLMPSAERRAKTMALAGLRSAAVVAGQAERSRAMELLSLGFRYMDALHVACAESARCDVLLSTDDALVSKSRAHKDRIMIQVANPLRWIAEVTEP